NGAKLHVTFLERALKRGTADPDALDAVHVVGDEIKRLSDLVTEFLDFARPKPLTKKAQHLRAVCERAMQLVAPAAEAAGVRVRADFPSADIELALDRARFEQVLLNLLQNAVEAVQPGGGGTVILRLRRQPRDAIVEVEDDGPGLSSPD